jgi:hypothetical protein
MTTHDQAESAQGGMRTGTSQRMLMWLVLAVLTALVVYFGFRGYLSPELLFHFANGLHC